MNRRLVLCGIIFLNGLTSCVSQYNPQSPPSAPAGGYGFNPQPQPYTPNIPGIQSCGLNPCRNGGVCIQLADGTYRCDCPDAWTGINCTVDVNECLNTVLNRCHKFAVCTNVIGRYTCTCNPGFRGDGFTCEDENLCLQNPCANGGICINEISGYSCACVAGWTGSRCITDIDDCRPNPCQNGGQCLNGRNTFTCRCPSGFKGLACEYVETLFPDKVDAEIVYGDDVVSGPHKFISGFPLAKSLHYKLYVSMNGYIIFDDIARYVNPPSHSPDNDLHIVAPFWTDIATTGGLNSALYVSTYNKNNQADVRVLNEISIASQLRINMETALVATWANVVPFTANSSSGARENATFQAVLATDGLKTAAIFNYDPTEFHWACSEGEHITIGYTDIGGRMNVLSNSSGNSDPCFFTKQSNRGISGRWVSIIGSVPTNQKKVCLDWVADQNVKNISNTIGKSEPCPCSRRQAEIDQRFMYNATTLSARSRFVKAGTIQTCNYDGSVHGSLLKGFPNGGHAIIEGKEIKIDEGWTKCCQPSDNYCSLFYGVWPSDTCIRYRPPVLALVWGDPHVMTLDGYEYTFNGWGEYTLLDIPNVFQLQGRTGEAPSTQLTPSKATVLTAVAAKAYNSDKVELRYHPQSKNSIHVTVGGTEKTLTTDYAYYNNVMVDLTTKGSAVVSFSMGMAIEVHSESGFLSVTVLLPQEHFNAQSRGLLGVADGDINNDIVFRNGTVLNTTIATEKMLFEFGQTWRIEQHKSLFSYYIDDPLGNFQQFQNLAFVPMFYSDIASTSLPQLFNNNRSLVNHARLVCNNTYACLIDYAATGDEAIAIATNKLLTSTISNIDTLGNSPPKFLTLPYYLTIMAGRQFEMALNVFDNDTDDKLLFSLDTNLPGQFSIQNNMLRWLPPKSLRGVKGYLKVKVHDAYNASDLYWPELHVCACDSEAQCNWDEINAVEHKTSIDRYYEGVCNCSLGYKGDYCDIPYDICSRGVCYPGVTCTVTGGTTYTCGACPQGLHGDGVKCYDQNECLDTTINVCEQGCINTLGSYMCTCDAGYTVLHNNCEDINECKTTQCGTGQYCYNLPGSYECRCMPGYMQMGGRCEKAVNVSRYAGHIRFTTTRLGTVWSPQLTDKASQPYRQTVQDITTSLVQMFNSSATSFSLKHVQILQIQNGSIMADFDLYFSRQLSQGILDQAVDEAFQGCTVSCRLHSLLAIDRRDISVNVKDFCSAESNPCDETTSTCDSVNGTLVCLCKPGFKPSQLHFNSVCDDVDECSLDVCGEATCHNTVGSFQCVCKENFIFFKNTCINPCVDSPCANGGTCMGQSDLTYLCMCDNGWDGSHCEIESESKSDYWKTILIIVASCVGAICVTLVLILCAVFVRRRRNRRNNFSDVHSIHDMHSLHSASVASIPSKFGGSRKRRASSGSTMVYPDTIPRDSLDTWQRHLPPPPRTPYEDMEMRENLKILRDRQGSRCSRYSYAGDNYGGIPNMGYESTPNNMKHNPHYGYPN